MVIKKCNTINTLNSGQTGKSISNQIECMCNVWVSVSQLQIYSNRRKNKTLQVIFCTKIQCIN